MPFKLPCPSIGTRYATGLAILLCATSRSLQAQEETNFDVIAGHVTNDKGADVAGATVRALSREGHIARQAVTNQTGHFTIVFPDLAGPYSVEVRSLGYQPAHRVVARNGDEGRLIADLRMTTATLTLNTVRVTAVKVRAPAGSGGSATAVPGQTLLRLPVDASDLGAVASISPGVVRVAGDTQVSSISIAGQRPSLNSVIVDGLSSNGTALPAEAIRTSSIVTNSYDVARGQFTGGVISATTQSGGNELYVNGGLFLRNRDLSADPGGPVATSQFRTQEQGSLGLGYPIVHDRFFSYTALQVAHRVDDSPSLLFAGSSQLRRAGLSVDSVTRFFNALRALGVPIAPNGVPNARTVDYLNAFERVDYIIDHANTLTLTGNVRNSRQDGASVANFSLPSSGGTAEGSGGAGMVRLASQVDAHVFNDLRATASQDRGTAHAYSSEPGGLVQLTTEDAAIEFGSNPALPQSVQSTLFEITNQVSWIAPGGHVVRFGLLGDWRELRQRAALSGEGLYLYNGLAALEANQPSSFFRQVGVTTGNGRSLTGGAYLGDAFLPMASLRLQYGVRLEGASYYGPTPYNADVERLFVRRTDKYPADLSASPRIGFTWTLAHDSNGRATTSVRGGIGEFRAIAPLSLFAAANAAPGLPGAQTTVSCTGADIPIPTWTTYTQDPPGACNGSMSGSDANLPTVAVIDPRFKAPRAWRGSLTVRQQLLAHTHVSVTASYARGFDLFGVRDLNLNTTPQFTISSEHNRPVFVPASAIDPQSGQSPLVASRLQSQYGNVFDIYSGLGSETRQLTVNIVGSVRARLNYDLSYTWSHVRDQSSFPGGLPVSGFSSATTDGNPNDVAWSRSSLEREHQVVGWLTFITPWRVELSAIGHVTSGVPYTPTADGDLNGDGVLNDRAFVFDPRHTGDTAVAAAMQHLLTETPARIRDCLAHQLGTIAERNSCIGPWVETLDMQLNAWPIKGPVGDRVALNITFVNVLGGLDEALHGITGLRGWGQTNPPDGSLLFVQGFSPVNRTFLYSVNRRFGTNIAARGLVSAPFGLVIQARYGLPWGGASSPAASGVRKSAPATQ